MTAWLALKILRQQSEKEGHFLSRSYDAASGIVCDGSEARNNWPDLAMFRTRAVWLALNGFVEECKLLCIS